MSIETKIEKLRGLVNIDKVASNDFSRLVDGDLADLGDALVAGKQVRLGVNPHRAPITFAAVREEYEIVNLRITIGDVSFPAPEKAAPAEGTPYWTPYTLASDLASRLTWDGGDIDRQALVRGTIHLSKEFTAAQAA